MSTTNNGGPAFPTDTKDKFIPTPDGGMAPASHYGWEPHEGMSLRDYFAAKAMQAVLACEQNHPSISSTSNEDIADCAYEIADAMLKAREANNERD